ncbi:MAG TPA: hypothetical protein VKA83_21450 [Methylomirabilota bacterium]|nr:hypothetical protein [Methylomirabilota bacterium]
MDNLTLKLVVTPALIGAATLAGRRWGQSVGGWLVGLPLTTGPVAFFIALDQGEAFAAAAVVGSLAGAVAEVAFSLAYGWSALRRPWPPALLAGTVAYAAVAALVQGLALGAVALFALVIVALALSLRLMPRDAPGSAPVAAPRWDLPARMVLATAVVLVLTALAPRLGARWSGLLATYPLFAAILTAFGHRLQGAGAAIGVLRGLLFGLFSFAGFCLVLALGLVPLGIAGAFLAAIAVALLAQGVSLWRLRGPGGSGPS